MSHSPQCLPGSTTICEGCFSQHWEAEYSHCGPLAGPQSGHSWHRSEKYNLIHDFHFKLHGNNNVMEPLERVIEKGHFKKIHSYFWFIENRTRKKQITDLQK